MNEEQSSNTSALVVGALIVVAVVLYRILCHERQCNSNARKAQEVVIPVETEAMKPKPISKLV